MPTSRDMKGAEALYNPDAIASRIPLASPHFIAQGLAVCEGELTGGLIQLLLYALGGGACGVGRSDGGDSSNRRSVQLQR